MKMPLITASQRFAFSAGSRPGKAVFVAAPVAPQVFASAAAMSTSKPTILPLVVVYSIGGNVGSVQNLNVADWWAVAVAASDAATTTGATRQMTSLRMNDSSSIDPEPRPYAETTSRSNGITCGSIECSIGDSRYSTAAPA